jgi:hypothetical protein
MQPHFCVLCCFYLPARALIFHQRAASDGGKMDAELRHRLNHSEKPVEDVAATTTACLRTKLLGKST